MSLRRVPALAALVGMLAVGCSSGPDRPPAVAPPPSSTTATSAAALPPFHAAVRAVTEADVPASWRPGCPLPVAELRAVDARFVGFDGRAHDGRIVVHEAEADHLVQVLRTLYEERYPIHRMDPVDRYGGSDDASVLADNTSGFNCRRATGATGWSEHAYGRAVDLNPLENPYVRGATILPAVSAALVDRTRTDPGVIHDGDAAVRAFAAVGWSWGGRWRGATTDYQHFSPSGR